MKNIVYHLIKFWIKSSLHLYYRKININGLENVPKDKPVLFLPNHQNALLDPLLIAVDCNRKPYFLTRSDVFKSSMLNRLFNLVRMIPIYRIRDGRDSLKNNEAVFQRCSQLLNNDQSLLMFPEANHNLQRRVRPLSKGFTRILFKTLETNPTLDIRLVPVGLNYLSGQDFPDQVSIYYGKDIAVQDLLFDEDQRTSVERIKGAVSEALQKLTAHIPEKDYDEHIKILDSAGADYLDPVHINSFLKDPKNFEKKENTIKAKKMPGKLLAILFVLLNLPIILGWKLWLKPKVWEPEFTATLRFSLSLLAFPIYYLLLFFGLFFWFGSIYAWIGVPTLFIFNWAYVKFY